VETRKPWITEIPADPLGGLPYNATPCLAQFDLHDSGMWGVEQALAIPCPVHRQIAWLSAGQTKRIPPSNGYKAGRPSGPSSAVLPSGDVNHWPQSALILVGENGRSSPARFCTYCRDRRQARSSSRQTECRARWAASPPRHRPKDRHCRGQRLARARSENGDRRALVNSPFPSVAQTAKEKS